ncbi:MAG: hypothetical protein BWX80_03145 [Candidatus Hydrogenedentes bacterium ADurb.Bin101]|nr:MAG: hypothetical protein BWX80_03145 [Candidatus Hydrogenedentes bacterium ADurb.Bin101]
MRFVFLGVVLVKGLATLEIGFEHGGARPERDGARMGGIAVGQHKIIAQGVFGLLQERGPFLEGTRFFHDPPDDERPGRAVQFFPHAERPDFGESQSCIVHSGEAADDTRIAQGHKRVAPFRPVHRYQPVFVHARLGNPVQIAAGQQLAVHRARTPHGEEGAGHGGGRLHLFEHGRAVLAQKLEDAFFPLVEVEVRHRGDAVNVFGRQGMPRGGRPFRDGLHFPQEALRRMRFQPLPGGIEHHVYKRFRQARLRKQRGHPPEIPFNVVARQGPVLIPHFFRRPRHVQHGHIAQRRRI